jgi:hypothetical protein
VDLGLVLDEPTGDDRRTASPVAGQPIGSTMPVLHHDASSLAREHHGVITVQQLLELGCTSGQVRAALDRGELIRRHANVLIVAGAPPSWEQRVYVAVLAAGPGALASHRSAAALWGLDGSIRGRAEVVTPRHLRSWARHLGRIHESTDLQLAKPTDRLEIPCTGITRTIVDLGAVAPLERVQQAADDAVRRGLCSWDELLDDLRAHSRRGRRGVGALRSVLEHSYGNVVPDSHFNRLVEKLLLAADTPPLAVEHEVRTPDGALIGRVDLAIPPLRIAIELDGKRDHLTTAAFERDRARQNRLELAGWLVLRYTWKQFVETPDRIVAEVLAAVAGRTHP